MPTPQRLPIVNSDDGVWGDILRQYLLKEHYDDGTDNAVNGGHKTITIRPGTASAGTAPLKFTTGTLLTAPEAGAMEFAGDNYYLTDTSGPTRRKIAAYDDTSGATGDIYYRNSSGYFTRLAVGSTGDFLTVSGGIPSWSSSISNASTITLKDINFTLQDNTDTSKQLKFELSGISASTTRTLTVPDANTTIVGTDATQTLTNKTLTNPVINNIYDASGNINIGMYSEGVGASNYMQFWNSNGQSPDLVMVGGSTNIGINLVPKGTGTVGIYGGSGQTSMTLEANGSATNVNLNLKTKGSGVVMANGVEVATITGTETLTNKTLTSPRVNQILDTNGANSVFIGPTASAVNYFAMYNSATGNRPIIYSTGSDTNVGLELRIKANAPLAITSNTLGALANFYPASTAGANSLSFHASNAGSPLEIRSNGSDTNVGLNLRSKGTGTVQANGVEVATISGTQTFTNKTLTTPKIGTIHDSNGNTILDLPEQASAVNHLYIGNHSTGNSPVIGVDGSDTNINLVVQSKGTGVVYLQRTNGHSTLQAGGGYNGGNVNLELNSQGTGVVRANGVEVATVSGTQTLTNKTLDTTTVISGFKGSNGNLALEISDVASAVNHTYIESRATGDSPIFGVDGTDTNIDVVFVPKGAGKLRMWANTGNDAVFHGDGADTNVSMNLMTKGTGVVKANGNPVITTGTAIPNVTGTPSSSTYLRGDGTWATPSGASASGMLLPVLCMVPGDVTYTISSGSVTQISGTTFDGGAIAPAIGDRLLIAAAPASTGTGTAYDVTEQPANGIYVVTGNTTNLTVTRASDMSGSINPIGLSVYIEEGWWNGGGIWTVSKPTSGSFTYGTTAMEWIGTGGSSPSLTQLYINGGGSVGFWNGNANTYLDAAASNSDIDVTLPPFTGRLAAQGALCRLHTSYTLTNTASVQKLFNSTTNGRVTLAVGVYRFECLYSLSSMSGTSGNSKFSLEVTGGSALAVHQMIAVGVDGNSATAATLTGSMAVTSAFPASQHTADTATAQQTLIRGTFEVTTAGYVIPSITLVNGSAAIVAAGSYFECTQLTASVTDTTVGTWD